MKKRYVALGVLLFVLGLALFSYPLISNFYNDNFQTKVVDSYQKEVNRRSQDDLEKTRQEMTDYNKALATGELPPFDPFAGGNEGENFSGYSIVVDALEEQYGHMLGILSIPSIQVKIPIFNGISDLQLQRGAGVLPGTSLPVGGKSTHSVITGHRGLPGAKLFSDLPQMKVGDIFTLEVFGETLRYEVHQVKTILPSDVTDMQIKTGEDLVTLMTCTPYMLNTHRLIITGHRIPNEATNTEDKNMQMLNSNCYGILPHLISWALLLTVLILLVIVLVRLGKVKRALDKLSISQALYKPASTPPDGFLENEDEQNLS